MSLLMVYDKIPEEKNVLKRELSSFKENLEEISLPKDLFGWKQKHFFQHLGWQHVLKVRNYFRAALTRG